MARPFKILLVEDNPGDIELMKEHLLEAKAAVELHIARDGVEALEIARADDAVPDLILLDLNLPKKDGRQVLRELKRDPVLCRVPVVVLSSSDVPDDVNESYRLGASSYVQKPQDVPTFRAVARSIKEYWIETATLVQSMGLAPRPPV